jgi:hypothetical protein
MRMLAAHPAAACATLSLLPHVPLQQQGHELVSNVCSSGRREAGPICGRHTKRAAGRVHVWLTCLAPMALAARKYACQQADPLSCQRLLTAR